MSKYKQHQSKTLTEIIYSDAHTFHREQIIHCSMDIFILSSLSKTFTIEKTLYKLLLKHSISKTFSPVPLEQNL